jgi:hypothetical protein
LLLFFGLVWPQVVCIWRLIGILLPIHSESVVMPSRGLYIFKDVKNFKTKYLVYISTSYMLTKLFQKNSTFCK